jgi:hypothetical protein
VDVQAQRLHEDPILTTGCGTTPEDFFPVFIDRGRTVVPGSVAKTADPEPGS